jgi:MFS family permease
MGELPPFLLEALRFQNPRTKILRRIRDDQWVRVLSDWRVVRLILPLRQVCGNELPGWVRDHIDICLNSNVLRFRRIIAEYQRAARALDDAGAEHVVIKGFSLWPGYSEHPKYRPQSDIDLYCTSETILLARDALMALGYTPVGPPSTEHLSALTPPHSWKWNGDHFDPAIPISFELHFSWWDSRSRRIYPSGLEQFWARRQSRTLEDLSFPALAPVDNLAYTCLNLLTDFLTSLPAAEQIYGLARFLHSQANDRDFWKAWRDLHDHSLRRLEAVTFQLASQWFACRLSEEAQEEVDALPPAVQQFFLHFARSTLSTRFKTTKDGLWLHLDLLESGIDKLTIFLDRVVPIRTRKSNAPEIEVTKSVPNTTPSHSSTLNRCSVQYAKWFAVRSLHHLLIIPITLCRGIHYRLSRKNLGRPFWTFFVASFCFDLGMTMYFFLYNIYLLDRGFKESFLGWMVSAMNIGSIACTIPAGMLIQRIGIRKALFFCIAMVSTISVARAIFAPQFAVLGLALFGGFFTTIWAVAISPALALLTDEESRPFGFSMVFSSGIAAGILGHLAASRLPGLFMRLSSALSEIQAKRMVLLMSAAIVALALVPLWRLRMEAAAPEAKPKLYPRNPFLLRYLPALALWSVVTGSLSPLATVYFSQHLHTSLVQMGNIFSVSSLVQVLGILAAPLLFRKLGIVSGVACSQLLAALLLGFLAATSGALPAALIYVVFTGFLWMGEPGMFSLLMGGVNPEERAGASALNFLVISLVQAGAVAATGASFARFGYPTVLRTVAVVALMAAVAFWVLLGRTAQLQAKSLSVNVDA